jgi:hypothetical protein
MLGHLSRLEIYMNRLKNYVLMAAGFAVLAMTVGVFTAGRAIAQAVRAALVSNVDDPGRIPYAVEKICSPSASQICITNTPPVPAGKRLVVTHVSGQLIENLPSGTYIELTVSNQFRLGDVHLPVTYMGNGFGHNIFVFDQQELIFCDAGQALQMRLELGQIPDEGSSVTYTVSGYLLDCTAGPCAAIAP